MNQLVFLEPNKIDATPFTTSKVVAEVTGIRHDKIKVAIAKHKEPLETFGKVTSYGVTLESGQTEILYRLNEQQATLLVTFLKNTPVVIQFKTELVHQFFLMRAELFKRSNYRLELKPIRRDLTDTIQSRADCKTWDYKHFTDLAYRHATGHSAAQLRKMRNAPKKAVAVDYMTSEEIERVAVFENQISVLIQMGMNYYQVKGMLENAAIRRLTA